LPYDRVNALGAPFSTCRTHVNTGPTLKQILRTRTFSLMKATNKKPLHEGQGLPDNLIPGTIATNSEVFLRF